jgi:hypothetical protein
MTVDERYSLDSAVRASEEDRLAQWVADFLTSTGSDNPELAASLTFADKWWTGPDRLELDQLTRLAGPDGEADNVLVPIDDREWESDVDEMNESLEAGWSPPPLVVSCRVGGLFLEDGNHRHETLLRAGETHAWAVVSFDTEDDRDSFLAARRAP